MIQHQENILLVDLELSQHHQQPLLINFLISSEMQWLFVGEMQISRRYSMMELCHSLMLQDMSLTHFVKWQHSRLQKQLKNSYHLIIKCGHTKVALYFILDDFPVIHSSSTLLHHLLLVVMDP